MRTFLSIGAAAVIALSFAVALKPAADANAAGPVHLTATLSGANEVPPADPNGSGTADVTINVLRRQVCFTLQVQDITLPATAAHIHHGDAGTNGPIVVTLKPPDASGESSGCVRAPRIILQDVVRHPTGHYVNVHTTDFQNGAIRGQLAAP